MPNFINNKGEGIVPSLQTIVAVSPHLTAEHINQLPRIVARWTVELRRRCGVDVLANDQQIPLYITGEDLSYNVVLPYSSTQVDSTHPSAEQYREIDTWNPVYWDSERRKEANQFLSSWLPRTETVVFSVGMHYIKSVPYADKFALILQGALEEYWETELEDGWMAESVQRVVLQSVEYYRDDILTSCCKFFPRLTSIDMGTLELGDDCNTLSSFAGTLWELRLSVSYENFSKKLFQVISRLHKLEVLAISYNYSLVSQFEDPFPLLAASPVLRSLYLHNIHSISPEQIIHYFKEKVPHKGEMVERQEIFSDLTLTGYDLSVYETLYGSKDLSQSMKERIYCDKDIHHLSAAMVLLNQRNGNLIPDLMNLLFVKAKSLSSGSPQPLPVLLSLMLQLIRRDPYWDGDLHQFLTDWLLSIRGKTKQYDPAFLFSTTATLAYLFNKRTLNTQLGIKETNLLLASLKPTYNSLVHLLHNLVEDPPNIPAYLEMLVTLMRYDGGSGGLPGMFVKQAKKLTMIELMDFVAEREADLSALIGRLIFSIHHPERATPIRCKFPCPRELDDLLSLIMKSTKSVRLECYARKLIIANSAIPASLAPFGDP